MIKPYPCGDCSQKAQDLSCQKKCGCLDNWLNEVVYE